MPSSNLYSHPDRMLEDHLVGVANLSELFWRDKSMADQELLKAMSRIVALSHDLGKATKFFQDYLRANERDKVRLRNQPETHHGLFSAVCGYYLVKQFLTANKKEYALYPFLAFEAVRRHHGNLQDLRDEAIFDEGDQKLLNMQLESINEASFDVLAKQLFEARLPLILSKKLISEWVATLPKELRIYKKILREDLGTPYYYLLLNLIYSILLDADKSDVVVRESSYFEREDGKITKNIVDIYKSKLVFPDSPINSLRESAYREVLDNDISVDKKIYSINLPTGLGKTLTALAFALKLRHQITNQTHSRIVPRIIYALPFLSVIEQNADEFEKVIKASGIIPYASILLRHHHLSDVFYQKDAQEEFETDAAKIMIEGWNSEIIVTTFVQLFHTLISNKNKSLRKFHRLNNTIVILDEIQSIPIKYWLLTKDILDLLAKELNVYFIFVTATEPLIFDRQDVVSLVEREKYFQKMDRVAIRPLLDSDKTLEEVNEIIKIEDNKRYLFIFNTISAAKKFYELIKSKHKDISYLSTHVTPKERLQRIQNIKEKKYKVVVSTQLVEAGVDIDFDVVVRDIAPLDSINQAAGRCNRNSSAQKKGDVFVVSLKDENGRRFSSYIYDAVLLDITRRILSKHETISEPQFLELIEEYYEETSTKKSQEESRKILDAVKKLRYDSEDDANTSIADFRLIEEGYAKKDVFIELDQDASRVWGGYMMLEKIKGVFERKKAFDFMKAEFYQYVISIPAKTRNLPAEVGFLCYVGNSALVGYYNMETGYITKDDRSIVIW